MNYLEALFIDLVDQQDFFPVLDENGIIPMNENIRILQKGTQKNNIIVEIINADAFSAAKIQEILQMKKDYIAKTKGTTFFEVLVFALAPDFEKQQIIDDEIQSNSPVKCFSISLENKTIQKLFKTPISAGGIEKSLNAVLKSDYQSFENIDIYQLVDRKKQERTITVVTNHSYVTYALIIINIAVFLLLNYIATVKGVSYDSLLMPYGAKDNLHILNGEYWRFFTPMFLHANTTHLFLNCYSLFVAGTLSERIYGSVKFIFIYFIAGIIGCIASFAFSATLSVGASGAIFGLFGALLYYGLEYPKQFRKNFGAGIIITIVINLVYGLSNTGIDNFAHMGGLVGGFFASGIVKITGTTKKILSTPVFLVVTALLIFAGLHFGFSNTLNKSILKLDALNNLSEQKNWAEAEKTGNEIIGLNPTNKNIVAQTLWRLTVAQFYLGKYEDTIKNAQSLVNYSPSDGHYLLGISYYNLKQYDLAKQELTKAKNLNNPNVNNINAILKILEQKIK